MAVTAPVAASASQKRATQEAPSVLGAPAAEAIVAQARAAEAVEREERATASAATKSCQAGMHRRIAWRRLRRAPLWCCWCYCFITLLPCAALVLNDSPQLCRLSAVLSNLAADHAVAAALSQKTETTNANVSASISPCRGTGSSCSAFAAPLRPLHRPVLHLQPHPRQQQQHWQQSQESLLLLVQQQQPCCMQKSQHNDNRHHLPALALYTFSSLSGPSPATCGLYSLPPCSAYGAAQLQQELQLKKKGPCDISGRCASASVESDSADSSCSTSRNKRNDAPEASAETEKSGGDSSTSPSAAELRAAVITGHMHGREARRVAVAAPILPDAKAGAPSSLAATAGDSRGADASLAYSHTALTLAAARAAIAATYAAASAARAAAMAATNEAAAAVKRSARSASAAVGKTMRAVGRGMRAAVGCVAHRLAATTSLLLLDACGAAAVQHAACSTSSNSTTTTAATSDSSCRASLLLFLRACMREHPYACAATAAAIGAVAGTGSWLLLRRKCTSFLQDAAPLEGGKASPAAAEAVLSFHKQQTLLQSRLPQQCDESSSGNSGTNVSASSDKGSPDNTSNTGSTASDKSSLSGVSGGSTSEEDGALEAEMNRYDSQQQQHLLLNRSEGTTYSSTTDSCNSNTDSCNSSSSTDGCNSSSSSSTDGCNSSSSTHKDVAAGTAAGTAAVAAICSPSCSPGGLATLTSSFGLSLEAAGSARPVLLPLFLHMHRSCCAYLKWVDAEKRRGLLIAGVVAALAGLTSILSYLLEQRRERQRVAAALDEYRKEEEDFVRYGSSSGSKHKKRIRPVAASAEPSYPFLPTADVDSTSSTTKRLY